MVIRLHFLGKMSHLPEKMYIFAFMITKQTAMVIWLLLAATLAVGQSLSVRTLHYTTREGMASNVVNTIIQDRQGYLWLGTNLGLTRFDGYRFVNFYREENGMRRMENVTGIVEDSARNRLIVRGTDYNLYSFDLGKLQFAVSDTSLQNLYYRMKPTYADEPATVHRAWERGVTCRNNTRRHDAMRYVTLPNGNEVWTTIDNGVYVYDSQTKRIVHLTSADPRPVIDSDLMSEVLLDRSGTVWMTNYVAGLYQLQFADSDVRHHHLDDDPPSDQTNSVRSFSELPDGGVLVSNMNGDVYRYYLSSHRSERILHREHRVYSTLTDPRERLWVATRGDGVWVGSRHLNTNDGLTANIVFHLFRTTEGTMWISTLDGGLIAARERKDGSFSFTSYLKEEKVHQVCADHQGHLWVATESGVFMSNGEGFRRICKGTKVVAICCTGDDRVLAATIGNGLLIVDPQTAPGKSREYNIQYITTANGLANDCVKAVAWERNLGIVAATDAGITVIAPNGETRNVFSPEGMMADTYNESAALLLSNGHILLGSLDGFVEIANRGYDARRSDGFHPVITCVSVNDIPHYKHDYDTLALPHNQNNLTFSFSCLDSRNQASIIYNYRLDGADNDWHPSTKEGTALYNNLSPGRYRFRLRAAQAGRPWGEETTLDILIRQPWWWTWRARIIYLLTILILIWYEWRHYSERQRLRRQLDQRLTALYATSASIVPAVAPPLSETGFAPNVSSTETVMSKPSATNDTKTADKAFLDKLDSIILPNLLQENLDIAFLAEQMYMSHSTLYRRIKALTGMTANEYVRKHRLAKAMQLLRNGTNATEAAMQCGFSSPSYFTRCFKAAYGMPPSEV